MKRRLLNFLTALSLLLCVGVVALWVRSYWVGDQVKCDVVKDAAPNTTFDHWTFDTLHGDLNFVHVWRVANRQSADVPGVYWDWATTSPLVDRRPALDLRPVLFESFGWDGTRVDSIVTLPFWFPAGVFALMPACRLYRRVHRHPPGCCRACGYDLRATPGRCPECGITSCVSSKR